MSKSAPKAPDYRAAAEEQAQSSREVTNMQTWANRPQQNTPWGSSMWTSSSTIDPATGQPVTQWQQDITLSPQQQAALDSQMAVQQNRGQLAESMLTRMNREYAPLMNWNQMPTTGQPVSAANLQTGLDYSGAPALPDVTDTRNRVEDAIYGRATSRLDPRFQQQESDMRSRLYNQGLREGDAAWEREFGNFGRDKTDAYQTAMNEAIMGGGQEAARDFGMGLQGRQQAIGEINRQGDFYNQAAAQQQGLAQQASAYQTQQRQQAIAEEMQRRGFSLNEINAILTGQQVGMPAMPNFSQAAAAQPVQALSAAQMQGQANLDAFNAEQQALQGMMSGAGSLAGGFMGFSDRRLKTNVVKLCEVGGVNIYRWTYVWGEPSIGVMADEVPWAAEQHSSGYYMVDYSRIW